MKAESWSQAQPSSRSQPPSACGFFLSEAVLEWMDVLVILGFFVNFADRDNSRDYLALSNQFLGAKTPELLWLVSQINQ